MWLSRSITLFNFPFHLSRSMALFNFPFHLLLLLDFPPHLSSFPSPSPYPYCYVRVYTAFIFKWSLRVYMY